MSSNRKRIYASVELPVVGSILSVGTVPVNVKWTATQLTFCNNDAAVRVVTVHFTETAGTAASDANRVVNAHPLAAGETWTCPDCYTQTLDAGMTIKAYADAATGVSLHASTVEQTL